MLDIVVLMTIYLIPRNVCQQVLIILHKLELIIGYNRFIYRIEFLQYTASSIKTKSILTFQL